MLLAVKTNDYVDIANNIHLTLQKQVMLCLLYCIAIAIIDSVFCIAIKIINTPFTSSPERYVYAVVSSMHKGVQPKQTRNNACSSKSRL